MKELFQGALSVREQDGMYIPIRFTPAQLQSYAKTEALRIRSMSPAGCRIAFHSAATALELDYKITGRARTWAQFDVTVNGTLLDSVAVEADEGHVRIPLSGDATVKTEVFLPHLVEVYVGNITADKPLLPVKETAPLWLCLGDSITQGMDARHPSVIYPTLTAAQIGYTVLNGGVGGGMFEADNLDDIGIEPALITIALGCNDWGSRKDATDLATHIDAYLKKLTSIYACPNIYGILPIWRSDADTVRSAMKFEEMRDCIRTAYEKYPSITVLDGMEMVPPMEDFYGDAGVLKAHPNEAGFLYYARNLSALLQCK